MRIISTRTIKDFFHNHPNAEACCLEWVRAVHKANWEGPVALRNDYPSASILPSNRVVFRLGGGNYRLVVAIHYNRKIVYIRFIGTHAEYDKIDANNI